MGRRKAFQLIEVLCAVGSGLAARVKLTSAAGRCWESDGEEGATGMSHQHPGAGCPQPSPGGRMGDIK